MVHTGLWLFVLLPAATVCMLSRICMTARQVLHETERATLISMMQRSSRFTYGDSCPVALAFDLQFEHNRKAACCSFA